MWIFVCVLQGLFVVAAGVHDYDTPCIRSLLKCSPFRLSLFDGKFSDRFIQDNSTLSRRCRSMDAYLECMQEAVLMHCKNDISPAEENFIKIRIHAAEVCKNVNNMKKAFVKSAACINRHMIQVYEACFPDYYEKLANSSYLSSLEGNCVLQTSIITCRKGLINEVCGPEAGNLYGRVKAVDMNLDFLCMKNANLQSPEFLLDISINSYVSLLLEKVRPVLRMKTYLQWILKTAETIKDKFEFIQSRQNASIKKTKIPPYLEDLTVNVLRRTGIIPPNLLAGPAEDDDGDDFRTISGASFFHGVRYKKNSGKETPVKRFEGDSSESSCPSITNSRTPKTDSVEEKERISEESVQNDVSLKSKQHSEVPSEDIPNVEHSPESVIKIEIYVPEEKTPDVKYVVMGEYKMPLEIHFDVRDKSYVRYIEVVIPERTFEVQVSPNSADKIRKH